VTADGQLTSQTEHPTEARRGPDAVVGTIEQVVAAAGSAGIAAIGVACAGQIDPELGAIVYAPNLGWRDVLLRDRLAATFGVPVVVDNDVRAAAWGEFRYGAHRVRSLLAVFVGTGIGSGAVLDGQLWRGAGNGAGELGHTQVVPDGLPCPCGARGCVEQYASGSGFQRRLQAAQEAGTVTRLTELCDGDAGALTAPMVAAAANSGDDLARVLWADCRRYLTMAVANAVTLINPAALILGGGVIESLPELFDDVAAGVLLSTTILARESLKIEHARLGEWSGVLGAAALAAAPR
jgi:glucokinase